MDPTPGCSSAQNQENILSPEEIRRKLRSISNLENKFHVQHGFFRWIVEKLSIFPEKKNLICYSPTFALRDSWWVLGLCPYAENGGRDGIALILSRHTLDPGPENVTVAYAFCLENSRNKIQFEAKEDAVFPKRYYDILEIPVLGNLRSFLAQDVDDTVTVICEIYVSHRSNRNRASVATISAIDQSLSANLGDLFRSRLKTNVSLEIPNYSLSAHKSIIWARSKTLARLLESSETPSELEIPPPCNISSLKCALNYMYSGSLDFVARNSVFSIGLYETACELSLPGLRDMLTPHKIDLKCQVEVQSLVKTCTFYNFMLSYLPYRSVATPSSFDEGSGMSVKVTVHKNNTPPRFVGIDIEVVGVARTFFAVVDALLLNKNCDPNKDVPAKLLEDSTVIKDYTIFAYFLISDEDVLPCVTNGNLKIIVTCTRYSLIYILPDNPMDIGTLSVDDKNWIDELSEDMRKLLETEKMSDISIVAGQQVFKVHRCVLAARCYAFYKHLFEENYEADTLEILNITPRTFSIILSYAYCGTMSHIHDLTLDDFKALLDVSCMYRIYSLEELCKQFLNLMGCEI